MAMEAADEDVVWGAVATSPSVSPPATSLSLHLLAASGAAAGPFLPGVSVGSPFNLCGGGHGSPFLPGVSVGSPFNLCGGGHGSPFLPGVSVGSPFLPAGGVCYRNVTASPSSSVFSPFVPSFSPLAAGSSPSGSVAPEDRRKKRMMKNRETASLARARKHTHTTRIESEVKELREGNEQLRIKYEKLKASVEVSVPVKKTLQRMLSAPF